ncbi:MAG: hypothetical protein L6R42_005246 [Xanthoria sp. 1 TBL-2021]|nr:MAG: hypothetical protein L6R42_005246 [Xanthoria sp. 1 TBL-2021]
MLALCPSTTVYRRVDAQCDLTSLLSPNTPSNHPTTSHQPPKPKTCPSTHPNPPSPSPKQKTELFKPHFTSTQPLQQYPKQWLNHVQITRGHLSLRIAKLIHLGTKDTKAGGNKEHMYAWTRIVEELRSLDKTISACGVALEAAERNGEMGTSEKWPWGNL